MVISGYSTALFSTWFHIPEWNLLFDCGDGVTASLGLKGGNVKNIFLTHADRDHISGLFQFLQINARDGLPHIYFPADSGSFPAIREFLTHFDPHTSNATWHPVQPGDEVEIKPGLFVKAIINHHIPTSNGKTKSLSYQVEKRTKKLGSEFKNLNSSEIVALRNAEKSEHLFETITSKVLGYSGDTPSDNLSVWRNTEILIHEATFLDASQIATKGNLHSSLDQVLSHIPSLNIKKLILCHFSARYSHQEIKNAVRAGIDQYNISSPVFILSPGDCRSNLLSDLPANI